MDILIDIQDKKGYISDADIARLSAGLSISRVDVEQTISFYHFSEQSQPRNIPCI